MGGSVRIALGIEYDGSGFHGWQTQPGVRTLQASLEEALSRVADHPVQLHCAGRTDAGVHALEQVAHFDTRALRSARAWVLGANVNLPPDVAVLWAQPVSQAFHARFLARGRHYRYRIQCRPTRSPLQRDRVVWLHRSLDVERMHAAAQHLVGTHDFSSFRARACQAKSPVRQVRYCSVQTSEAGMIEVRIGADGFLHHMVRNIVGVLMAIGKGEAPVRWVPELLAVRDRRRGGITAPPQGLYFLGVEYPDSVFLPQRWRKMP